MCPGWRGDNDAEALFPPEGKGGGDAYADPTRAVGPYGGVALVRPRDETKRGLDDPARIETRSCR